MNTVEQIDKMIADNRRSIERLRIATIVLVGAAILTAVITYTGVVVIKTLDDSNNKKAELLIRGLK